MNIMLTLRQVRRLFWGREKSERCEICDIRFLSGDFICEDATCQMQALEAQAMLGSYTFTLKSSANRRRTVSGLAAALPAKPEFDSYTAPSAWAF